MFTIFVSFFPVKFISFAGADEVVALVPDSSSPRLGIVFLLESALFIVNT